MTLAQSLVFGCVFCFTLMFFPQISKAEIFKSSEFLTWEKESREFYIRTSIGMAVLIADQNDKNHAECVGNWYAADEQAKNLHILNVMKRFPNYHPRGVLLAVLEKACGKFKYSR